jgi:hypothetical protein
MDIVSLEAVANGDRYRDSDSDSDLGLYSNMWTNLNAKETCYIAQLVTGWHVGTRFACGSGSHPRFSQVEGSKSAQPQGAGEWSAPLPEIAYRVCRGSHVSLERRGRPRSK